jgi:hypothetical protein
MGRDKTANSAYMRDYRRRRKLNDGQPLGPRPYVGEDVHRACDKRIKELEEDNRKLREMLPF